MKIALITGGSRGLGKSMALHLAQKGHDVIITYQHSKIQAQNVLDEIVQGGQKAVALQLDVSQSSSFTAFLQTLKSSLQAVQFAIILP